MTKEIEAVAQWFTRSKRVVVFSGAGLSTESGIPDFRSPGGIWDRYDPTDFYFQNFISSEKSREKYWEMSSEYYIIMKRAKPNPARLAIKKSEDIEEKMRAGIKVPYCDGCSGILKPATVSFGQAMPEDKMMESIGYSLRCDLCIVLGSSLVVYPA